MKPVKVDLLNIGLIITSLVLAYVLPFWLFLVAYAVLGPLHYLTEINWLRDKQYFIKANHRWGLVTLICVAGVVVPKFFIRTDWGEAIQAAWLRNALVFINDWSNALIFLGLVLAIAFVLVRKPWLRWLVAGVGAVLAIVLHTTPLYTIMVGLLIPTIIHVYIFTMLFMLYGALRNNSMPGYASVVLTLLVPVIIALVPINGQSYFFSTFMMDTFGNNKFHLTNVLLAKFLGLSDGTSFVFKRSLDLKLQVFISFAYLYHYLNWFSKTTIIGWHKNLTQTKSLTIVVLWLVMAGLFYYDYRVGFLAALFFSFLHVLMEFPLNVFTIKEIGKALTARLSKA